MKRKCHIFIRLDLVNKSSKAGALNEIRKKNINAKKKSNLYFENTKKWEKVNFNLKLTKKNFKNEKLYPLVN